MKKTILLLIPYFLRWLAIALCVGGSLTPCFSQGAWSPRASLPDTARAYGIGFAIGNYGYIGLGYSYNGSDHYYKDFWQFNPSTNSWTRKADFPGRARISPTTFVIGSKAYVIGGRDSLGNFLKECWQYNAITNVWIQKNNFSGVHRDVAVAFSIGGKGYFGTGFDSTAFLNDFWSYDSALDSWTQLSNFSGGVRAGANAFAVGSNGYLCLGFYSGLSCSKDMWEYDTTTDTWTQKANFPGIPINGANGFAIGTNIYVGTGEDSSGHVHQEFWKYNTIADAWTSQDSFLGSARNYCSAFQVADTGYIGVGNAENTYYKDLYKFYPDTTTGLNTIMLSENSILVFPNPFMESCTISMIDNNTLPIFTLWDIQGRKMNVEISKEGNNYMLNRGNLSAGSYILSIQINGHLINKKLIINN